MARKTKTPTLAPSSDPTAAQDVLEVIPHVLDNGGVTDAQLEEWRTQYAAQGGVQEIRVYLREADRRRCFPAEPAPLPEITPEGKVRLKRLCVVGYIRPYDVNLFYEALAADGQQARAELALNRVWLGGSKLIEQAPSVKCDVPIRVSALQMVIQEVFTYPMYELKKS